ncbi:MAG: hypothetical protein KAZ26_19975 [Caldilineaceae bacterium]|nr:hypothetical protein [Caldilineaceae bacterium]
MTQPTQIPTLAEAAEAIRDINEVLMSYVYPGSHGPSCDCFEHRQQRGAMATLARLEAYDEQAEALAVIYEDAGIERLETHQPEAWFNIGVTED